MKNNISINQIGYKPNNEKVFLLPASYTKAGASFYIIEKETGNSIFKGKLEKTVFDDTSLSGKAVAAGDFSKLTAVGTYRIVQDKNTSPWFIIADDVYEHTSQDALRSLFLVRANIELNDEITGLKHPAAHLQDFNIDGKDYSGGWYNAGDYGKWTHCSAITIANLLWLYKLNPNTAVCTNDASCIVESGNGIPDILDEARWGLEWLLKMQNDDGSVYHKVDTEPDFAWGEAPEQDAYERSVKWTDKTGNTPSTIDAADFCGAAALASRVFSDTDPVLSRTCRDAAFIAWDWIKDNPDNPQNDPYYSDSDTKQELFWAAAEMYVLSKGREGTEIIEASNALTWINPVGWQTPELFGILALLYYKELPDTLRTRLETGFKASAERLLSSTQNHAYRHAADSFWWGSNLYVTGTGQLLASAAQYFSNNLYKEAALDQLHYILGRNALNQCFICGHGSNPVKHPYHWAYHVYDIALPGWISGGANAMGTGGDKVLDAIQEKETPPALCFADVCSNSGSWASNEGTITMTSSFLFLAGMF